MANPVTSIVNPLKDRIILYWVTAEQQLALRQPPLDDKLQPLNYSVRGIPKGNYALQQCIAAVYLRGMPTVFGMVLQDDHKTRMVSQISPITNYITDGDDQKLTTTTETSLAAASDGDNKAWIYYLSKSTLTSDPVVMETFIDYDSAKTRKMPKPNPSSKSRLAVAYVEGTKNCTLFFQVKNEEDNSIYWVTAQNNSNPITITDTENAMDGTPIAVVQNEAGDMYLYYMSSQYIIQRATKRSGSDWIISTEKMTQFITQKLLSSSQITAVLEKEQGSQRVHVYYIEKDEDKYTDHVDTSF